MPNKTGKEPQIWDKDCCQQQISGITSKRNLTADIQAQALQALADSLEQEYLDAANTRPVNKPLHYTDIAESVVYGWKELGYMAKGLSGQERALSCITALQLTIIAEQPQGLTVEEAQELACTVIRYEGMITSLQKMMEPLIRAVDMIEALATGKNDRILENLLMGVDIDE